MAIMSRNKGKVGELEICTVLRSLFGWRTRRSQQHCGTESSADIQIEETPSLWVECKRVERLCVPKTMVTAVRQAGRKCAVLLHRPNRSEWLLTIRLVDLPRLVHAYDSAQTSGLAATALPGNNPGDSQGGTEPAGAARLLPNR